MPSASSWAITSRRASSAILPLKNPRLPMIRPSDIFLSNTSGIYVANHCLGIPAMVVFTLIILSFGGALKHKLWYIPLGIIGILFINCMRIVGLVVLLKRSSPFFWELNHKYALLILTYGFIFWMVKVWMDKFADQD